ncbi:MAG TPA: SgcJ/EcaC family oxidoreductase [Pyrinomonadaceae bacterium]|jgi:uncharacterized protein (TIGR02246 family)
MKMSGKIIGTILILICASALGFAQEKTSGNQDEAAVRQIVKSVEAGWNAHDGKAFAAPFAPDADYVIVNGMHIKGRDAIEKGHVGIFTTVYKDSRNAATIKSVRFLRPDVAVVHVEWNLDFKANGETRKGHAMNTMIMTKDNGKWSIAAFHNTPVMPQGN